MTHAPAMPSPPNFADAVPDRILATLEGLIGRHDALVRTAVETRPADFGALWLPLERASVATDAFWSMVGHLQAVADTPALREAHAAGQKKLAEHSSRILQDLGLFDCLGQLADRPDFEALPLADRVAVQRSIEDFTLAGVALEPAARARLAEIRVELATLSDAFASAVLDATDAWGEHVEDEDMLAGLSSADKAMLTQAARDRGLGGWFVTLQMPHYSAVMRFSENRELRARVYEAFQTRASECGPHDGRNDNGQRIARILALRREAATLLGHAESASWLMARRMARDPLEVTRFLRELAAKAKPVALRELDAVREHAREALGIARLEPWDIVFVSERLRRRHHAIDEQAIRTYFPVERVLAGWQALVDRLFGIRLRERQDVAVYHPDVRYFDVLDEAGTVFAGIYADLHARAGKRGGAWMAEARPRLANDGGGPASLPISYLVCNFPPRGDDIPSLLSHEDVQTLLHETGHCLHLLLTRVDRPSIAGTRAFEWDAIELPSQVMEDFAWDRDVLASMSGHHVTGEKLPAAQFERMTAARHFQAAMMLLRQIEYSLFDLELHLGPPDADPNAVLTNVRNEVAVVFPPGWARFANGFAHIFAGGYAAGYYSYLWAEVLAADAFGRFMDDAPAYRTAADALRHEILSRGATRPASESFQAFRGRAPDLSALLRRRGLT